ncbi:hypothetical protein [Kineosporia rhizophila]|nr:hypothetical protein [Kineosporia rhizophila]
MPRLGIRVFPQRRRRAGIRVESLVLAVLVLVLGLLVAVRIPF